MVPEGDRDTLVALEQELQIQRSRLAELDQQYTREYLALKPQLRAIPERIDELEAEIAEMKASGGNQVLDEAQQRFSAARRARSSLEQQLAVHKQEVAGFVATQPERLRGVGPVDISRPMDAVREIRRCVNELGFVGILVATCRFPSDWLMGGSTAASGSSNRSRQGTALCNCTLRLDEVRRRIRALLLHRVSTTRSSRPHIPTLRNSSFRLDDVG